MNTRVDVVYDWRKKADACTPAYVCVRVYYNRKDRRYVNTGVKVLPSEWDDRLWVIRRDDANVLNDMIREQLDKCIGEVRGVDVGVEDVPSVKKMKVDRSDASFLDWMEREIERQRIAGATKKHHRATLRYLIEWGKMRRWEHVTRRNVQAFLDWVSMQSVMKPVGGVMVETPIEQSTVHGHWKRLRKYVNIAIGEGYVSANALYGMKVECGASKEREYLTDDELERMSNTLLSTECLRMARDRFLVQCGTGLAYADLMATDFSRREVVDGNVVVSGTRVKTGERFFLVVLPMCVPVLERWGWKVPAISNVDYNKFLGRVAIECGINKHITSHVGRHTYACYCLRHGVRIEAVQRTLGHAKISTTQIYARMADMDVVHAFKDMR